MGKKIGFLFVLISALVIVAFSMLFLKASFWLAAPQEKFIRSWQEDIALLEKSNKLPKEWFNVREVRLRTDNSPVQSWTEHNKHPIKMNPNGTYALNVMLIHWIEGYRYGVVIQYNLVDTKNDNTIWELGRTLKLGIVY